MAPKCTSLMLRKQTSTAKEPLFFQNFQTEERALRVNIMYACFTQTSFTGYIHHLEIYIEGRSKEV